MKSIPQKYRILVLLILTGGLMGGIAYASVPLYTLFCKTTGYGGTPQRAEAAPTQTRERWVTVTFDTNVDTHLPWDFTPDVHEMRVKLGETYTATFHAHNRSDKPVTGMATFNVQPDKAGTYFTKMQCFCFDKQVLNPGQTAMFPVEFYVDPAIADDKNTDDVQNITLSYTFFRAKDQSSRISRTAQPKNPENPT